MPIPKQTPQHKFTRDKLKEFRVCFLTRYFRFAPLGILGFGVCFFEIVKLD
jgi:hypothetical protein